MVTTQRKAFLYGYNEACKDHGASFDCASAEDAFKRGWVSSPCPNDENDYEISGCNPCDKHYVPILSARVAELESALHDACEAAVAPNDELLRLSKRVTELETALQDGYLHKREDYFPEVAALRKRNREMHDRAQAAEKRVAELEAEIKEARNEAATVRRAYLHERGRAQEAIEVLRVYGIQEEADSLEAKVYTYYDLPM